MCVYFCIFWTMILFQHNLLCQYILFRCEYIHRTYVAKHSDLNVTERKSPGQILYELNLKCKF